MALTFQRNGRVVDVRLDGDIEPLATLSPVEDNKWWFEMTILTCLYADELEQIANKLKELHGPDELNGG